MQLSLLNNTLKIIEEVKDKTGKSIDFRVNSSLNTYALAKTARSSMAKHIIYYNPIHNDIINYIIAHECGHMIRMYEIEKEFRLMPYSDETLMEKAILAIEKNIKRHYSFQTKQKVYPLWIHGIITQLTSIPEDVRIEHWLFDNYPELHDSQQAALEKQCIDIQGSIAPENREKAPEFIYDGSGIINVFYLASISHIIQSPVMNEIKQTVFYEKGLVIYNEIKEIMKKENSLTNSIEISNYLAKNLGFNSWFKWHDFENIPEGYEDKVYY